MATVIGDRDVLLLGSSQRALNPLNADILLTTSAPAFKVDTGGNPLPSTITVKASLIGITGLVAFTATGATVTDNHDNTATLPYSSLTASSCTITASITVNGQSFSRSITLAKVLDGQPGSAGASGNQYATVYLYQWNSSLPANPSGTSGYTWATGVNSTYTGSDGWSVSVPTNPGTASLRLYVASVQITATGGTTSSVVSYSTASVQAWAQNGANGANAITGLLTNEATTYSATSAGVVSDLTPGNGTFKVYSGATDVTGASVTYSVVSQSGCTVTISATGAYTVTGLSASQATATLQAVYGGVTVQKIISLAKSVAGATGTASYVVVSSTGQVFSRANSAASFTPSSLTLTATPYGGTATYQWQYWNGTAWTNVASAGTSSTYVVASGDFTDTRSYRVQATIGGTVYTDQMTLVQVTGGTNGTNAIQSALVQVYQWAASIPAAPTGTTTYTWSSGTIAAIPTGWASTPGTAPSQGMTLWAARVFLTDSAANSQTTINWTSSAVVAVGYSGSNGSAGAAGASYVTAYCASSTTSTTTAPTATTGKTSLPAINSGGITGTWSATVPALTSGQYLYQSDGIYDPTTNQVTWSIPYWSSLKVGNLSAITANMGSINAGNIDLGSGATSWHVDATGNMWAGASTLASAPFSVTNAGNAVLNNASIIGSIKGGAYTGYSWPASGTGFYIGPEGLLLGNPNVGQYFQVEANGNVWSKQFNIVNGVATFSGTMNAGSININNNFVVSSTGATTIQSATTGQRTVITNSLIQIYDSSNTLRVRLGVW